jgi:hypothetical protein
MIQLKFDLTVDDKVAFARMHLRRSPSQNRSIRTNQLSLAVVFVVMGAVGAIFKFPVVQWTGLAATIMCLLFYPWHHRRLVFRRTERKLRASIPEGFVDHIEMTADEVGLRTRDGQSDVTFVWTSLLKVESVADHTFLYLKGGNALVIPRKAVTAGDYAAFVVELNERIKQHSI